MASSLLTLSALVALSALPSVAAQSVCRDRYGRSYYCNGGLGYGSRWGIGVGIAAAVILLMMMLLCCRRRRVHKANLVYAQQQSAEMGQNYQPPNQGGMQGAFFPHYQNPNQPGMFNKNSQNPEDVQPPPPAYNPTNNATANGNHYAPPAGPPPGVDQNSSEAREWAQHQENLREEQRRQNGGH